MKTGLTTLALIALLAAAGWTDGAGGMFLGYTFGAEDVPGSQRLRIPASGEDLIYFGGYGYGVGRWGYINGGFGFSVLDRTGTGSYAGGGGGFITGIRALRTPLHLALVSWTGVGGLYDGERGWFVGYEEVDLEVGIPFAPWFMPVAYVGYQVVGNLVPGLPFRESLTHNPVAGVRILWGSFR